MYQRINEVQHVHIHHTRLKDFHYTWHKSDQSSPTATFDDIQVCCPNTFLLLAFLYLLLLVQLSMDNLQASRKYWTWHDLHFCPLYHFLEISPRYSVGSRDEQHCCRLQGSPPIPKAMVAKTIHTTPSGMDKITPLLYCVVFQ